MSKIVKYRRVDTEDEEDDVQIVSVESSSTRLKTNICTRKHKMGVVFLVILALGLGFVIGVYIPNNKMTNYKLFSGSTSGQQNSDIEKEIQSIIDSLDKKKIRENLRQYSSRPRMSGTPGGNEIVDILYHTWKNYGLDNVRMTPYDVLMSYPNVSNPNKVQLLSNDNVVFESKVFEDILDESSKSLDHSEAVLPFNAFAPAGIVEGDLVYVNYGRIEDFSFITKSRSIDLNGKIVIARYGKIYRGYKVRNAEQFNASGILIYTDPADFSIYGTSDTYPKFWWMPDSGVQRGTIGDTEDYLTPFYPAKEYAYRKNINGVNTPKIPAQPISYGDALHLLRGLKGPVAPFAWRGKLPLFYRLGPGFINTTLKVKLIVNNFEEVRRIHNVVGYISGAVEPDRYVILGNHHDAWVFGAVDPLSGTATQTDIVRVLTDMVKKGIRPKRTIVFCSWGAEEHGRFGSTEWVEEYMKILFQRAVAYLNVDHTCKYRYVLSANVSPLLQDVLYESAKKVPNPDTSSDTKTMYDIWNQRYGGTEPSVVYSLGGGGDFAAFYQRAGVPCVDMLYYWNWNEWHIPSYPAYHSAYDTFHYFEKFIDPDFSCTLGMARLWAAMTWALANQVILPFDVRRYATAIESFIGQLTMTFEQDWRQHNVNIECLKSASRNFTTSTNTFHTKLLNQKSTDSLKNRILNDKMIQLERAFLDPEGLPGRRKMKHVVFAPSLHNIYVDNSFPGISDTMFDIQHKGMDKWEQLKQQISVATYTIQSAANTLEDIGL